RDFHVTGVQTCALPIYGVLDPLAGVGPSELKIDVLLRRIAAAEAAGAPVHEVIVATSPNVEGDATALYLAKLLRPLGVRVSRIRSEERRVGKEGRSRWA